LIELIIQELLKINAQFQENKNFLDTLIISPKDCYLETNHLIIQEYLINSLNETYNIRAVLTPLKNSSKGFIKFSFINPELNELVSDKVAFDSKTLQRFNQDGLTKTLEFYEDQNTYQILTNDELIINDLFELILNCNHYNELNELIRYLKYFEIQSIKSYIISNSEISKKALYHIKGLLSKLIKTQYLSESYVLAVTINQFLFERNLIDIEEYNINYNQIKNIVKQKNEYFRTILKKSSNSFNINIIDFLKTYSHNSIINIQIQRYNEEGYESIIELLDFAEELDQKEFLIENLIKNNSIQDILEHAISCNNTDLIELIKEKLLNHQVNLSNIKANSYKLLKAYLYNKYELDIRNLNQIELFLFKFIVPFLPKDSIEKYDKLEEIVFRRKKTQNSIYPIKNNEYLNMINYQNDRTSN